MTVATFLKILTSDIRADIGPGELTQVDVTHIRAIVEETLDKVTADMKAQEETES